jgi:glutamate N-acetyltransferase / amino-acid N-acetyltransferase
MTIKFLSSGGVTSPKGFLAAGMHAGIKKSFRKFDVSLIYSGAPAVSAAAFTTNRVKAWPLLYDLKAAVHLLSAGLKIPKRQILISSTGIIGRPFPTEKIEEAIPKLIENLSKDGGHDAARGILTTDTHPKETAARFWIDRKRVTLAAMAKGAGMVCPDMNAARDDALFFDDRPPHFENDASEGAFFDRGPDV